MDPHYEKRLHGIPMTSPVKRIRTQSPLSSPVKENYSDRFIPVRKKFGNSENSPVSLIHKSPAIFPIETIQTKRNNNMDINLFASQHISSFSGDSVKSYVSPSRLRHSAASTYTALITNEMNLSNLSENVDPSFKRSSVLVETENRNTHQYKIHKESPNKLRVPPYTTSPINYKNQALLKSPRKIMRKVPRTPYKVLDAPDLQDDFYLNLVDWSSSNILAVGLGSCVYLWNAASSQVTRLCDMTPENDTISSVSWNEKGTQVAVGTYRGIVQIWDAMETRMMHIIEGHTARVGSLTWNENSVVSGSRDRTIRIRDIRAPSSQTHSPSSQFETAASLSQNERIIKEHKQEVCGLRWSPDKQMLASGGNDNRLMIWSANNMSSPLLNYEQHSAAVKAIAWSPHIHGLLASGGGTADKTIRFWNTLTGQPLHFVDTGSQVCNIAWSNHTDEVISTHGYSQNQILLWSYPSMQQFGKLTGHTFRVLYLSVSPDGENIVTGAGDETLRFWSVFRQAKNSKVDDSRLVMLDMSMR